MKIHCAVPKRMFADIEVALYPSVDGRTLTIAINQRGCCTERMFVVPMDEQLKEHRRLQRAGLVPKWLVLHAGIVTIAGGLLLSSWGGGAVKAASPAPLPEAEFDLDMFDPSQRRECAHVCFPKFVSRQPKGKYRVVQPFCTTICRPRQFNS